MHDGKSMLSLWCQEGKQHTLTGSYQRIDHTALYSWDADLFGQAAAAYKTAFHLHEEARIWVINSKNEYLYALFLSMQYHFQSR